MSKKYRSRCKTLRLRIPARFKRARTYWLHKHLAYKKNTEEKKKVIAITFCDLFFFISFTLINFGVHKMVNNDNMGFFFNRLNFYVNVKIMFSSHSQKP